LVRSARHDVLVFTTRSVESPKARALARSGVEVFRAPGRAGRVDLREVIRELGRRQMLNVLLEAGAALNGSALEAGLVDKLVLFYAPRIIGAGGVPLAQLPSRSFAKSPPLSNVTLERCEPDFVVEGYFHDVYRDHRRRGKN
jgi:diaminohydroxyphosphoribosylaminopyrimidine deaminase/5-amino-6-(5-phosphoribosylamino)uracil reductase